MKLFYNILLKNASKKKRKFCDEKFFSNNVFFVDFKKKSCYDISMFWVRGKKYYEILLNVEDDARQIRTFNNAIVASNQRGKELYGEFENPFSFLKDAENPQSVQKLIDAYCTQTPIEMEIKTTHTIYAVSLKKIKNAILIATKDKTPEYALHLSLTKQLEFMSDVLSSFVDPVYLTDKQGTLIYVNKAFCLLTNTSFDNALGKNIHSFILDGSPDFIGFWNGLLSFKTKEGYKLLSVYQRPFEAHNNIYFSGVLKEKDTISSERSLYLFNESPLPLAVISGVDYQILQTNKAFINTFKQNENSSQKTNILDLFSENTKDILKSKLDKLTSGLSKTERIEAISLSEFGAKTFSIFISFTTPEKDTLIVYLIDASERKNLEMQFAHAQKMQAIGQLAGGIAHDFNNLLTAIIGFCDLLFQRHNPNDPSFLDIMQIKGNANKAAGLVGQLLTFSRKQPSKIQLLNFHDAFIDLSALLQRSISPFVTLKTEMKRNLGFVKMDPNQLTQIFLNLAVNAKDAMKTGGILKISATKERLKKAKPCGNDMIQSGEYIKIIVSDNGQGISAEHLPHIFEPFFTTKEGVTGSGTGLGLSTVYGIIRATGGYISVDSEKGIGTTFIIYLPRIDQQIPTQIELRPIRPVFTQSSMPANILLVDDEDGVRLVVARVLKSKGYHVTECANAEQALEILANKSDYSLLITDMIMPGMDGETLITKAKEAYPKLNTLLMSGYSEDMAKHSMENNNLSFIAKPFELNQLIEKVNEILEQ